VKQFKVLEVVSGLGMGGAEIALISRLKFSPSSVEATILNIRPQIDAIILPEDVNLANNNGSFIETLLFLLKGVRDFCPDLVLVRTPADVVRMAIVKRLSKNNFSFIFEAHSNFLTKKRLLDTPFRFLFNLASRQLDGIIAVSKSVKDGPLCRVGVPVQVCYLGSDIKIKASDLKILEKPKMIFVGRMVDLKRPLWLIERIASLRDKNLIGDASLTMVGDGPLLEEARRLVSNLRLENLVSIVGQQANVLPYLLEHTHLVSCSINEGLPITFYEAKLAGLRIISTPSGGGAEIFDVNDLVTAGFSEIEFEAVLEKVFGEPPPTLIEKIEISEASAWMSSQKCTENYYQAIFSIFENRRIR
jgi:glycosyltransferase involved in cell wall biosynthesis